MIHLVINAQWGPGARSCPGHLTPDNSFSYHSSPLGRIWYNLQMQGTVTEAQMSVLLSYTFIELGTLHIRSL